MNTPKDVLDALSLAVARLEILVMPNGATPTSWSHVICGQDDKQEGTRQTQFRSLKRLEKDARKLEQLASRLSTAGATLRRRWASATNVIAPINKLPVETLLQIFEHTIFQDDDLDSSKSPDPVILSHVCQKWRNITFTHRKLWTRICASMSSVQLLDHWVAKAGHNSLRLKFHLPNYATPRCAENGSLWLGLEELQVPVCSDNMGFPSIFEHLCRGKDGMLPFLKSLNLFGEPFSRNTAALDEYSIPSLTDLSICAVQIISLPVTHNLRHLNMFHVVIDSFFFRGMLAECPRLESLHMFLAYMEDDFEDDASETPVSIELPFFRELKISNCDLDVLRFIFQTIIAPDLCVLWINSGRWEQAVNDPEGFVVDMLLTGMSLAAFMAKVLPTSLRMVYIRGAAHEVEPILRMINPWERNVPDNETLPFSSLEHLKIELDCRSDDSGLLSFIQLIRSRVQSLVFAMHRGSRRLERLDISERLVEGDEDLKTSLRGHVGQFSSLNCR
ncbi:uncharacterized protein EI90DRAFT_3057654 [Cantharellus anzutake]|uniref:uncharacterized protein n=1 Tax=Cantharellus anzutake TaxID=1750568 RepID=UPI001902C73E|nr:uncharacterized protein EI90DRAFT_3057654 [Cantharellus anzutake]KAF8331358.1 hypothetical protein EI90DRAFT_3057654 [Cantharellus anzutake]